MIKLYLIAAALCVFHATRALSMTDPELRAALLADMQKYTTTVKSSKLFFNWADASDINPKGQFNTKYPPTAAHYRTYVANQGRKIFTKRSERDPDMYGPGLYLSSHPTASRSFGGKRSFGLIVGVIKPGTKLLATATETPITKRLKDELSKRDCLVGTFVHLLETAEANCTKMKQLLVGSDISFASGRLYDWGGMGNLLGCSSIEAHHDLQVPAGKEDEYDLNGTLIAYNANVFSDVLGFTHKSGLSGHKLSDEILSFLKGIKTHDMFDGAYSVEDTLIAPEQLADNKIPAMSKAQIKAFARKNILGCRP